MAEYLSIMYINVHTLNSTEPTIFVFGANIEQYKIHIMIRMQVILTKAEGQRSHKKKTIFATATGHALML